MQDRFVTFDPFCGKVTNMTMAAASSLAALAQAGMTERAFVQWAMQSSELRAEWVDGKVVTLPAVELAHPRIVQILSRLLGVFMEERGLGENHGETYQIRFAKLRRRR
jgi:hypothetical protein